MPTRLVWLLLGSLLLGGCGERDLSDAEPQVAARLGRVMQSVVDASTRRPGAAVELDPAGRSALRALGYLE